MRWLQLVGSLGNALIVGAQPRRQIGQTGVRGGNPGIGSSRRRRVA